jgi:hypothetical protein
VDCFKVALEVHLEMTAPVEWIAEGGTFEIHHHLHGGHHIFPTITHNPDIFVLYQRLVVSLVSCWIGQDCRTGERLEMVAVNVGINMPVVDIIDLLVA